MDSDKKSIIRAKSTISFEPLQDLMKEHIGEPTDEWMELKDGSLIKLYSQFFLALAQQTTRVNAKPVAQIGNYLWKMGMRFPSEVEAKLDSILKGEKFGILPTAATNVRVLKKEPSKVPANA